MAVKTSKDIYANMAYLGVLETAANTLTFAKLQIAYPSLLDRKYGLLINRCDIEFAGLSGLDATSDAVECAITVSDGISSLSLQNPEVLIREKLIRWDIGAAASGFFFHLPITRDFSTMPGGGILVPADRLFIAVKGTTAGNAMNAYMRLYYTIIELSAEDYWQLVESRTLLST